MTKKNWLTIPLTCLLILIFSLSLVIVACTPTAPAGDVVPKEELTKAQADLASEKDKVAAAEKKAKDLEAQLAAAQKPVEVYRWQPATWASSGSPWDSLVYLADFLNAESDGRFDVTPSAPEAICPVEEQFEAVSSGVTQAMATPAAYYSGKFPMAYTYGTSPVIVQVHDFIDFLEYFHEGRAQALWFSKVEGFYNLKCAGEIYMPGDDMIASNVAIRGVKDLNGLKFRCGDDLYANPLTAFGASTVWFPGTEIYTGMATGVVDAFTYANAYINYSMGFHEVTKYWIANPVMGGAQCITLVVNRDVWNGMPEDLQKMVTVAIDASTNRVTVEGWASITKSWEAAEEAGVEAIVWAEEDIKIFKTKELELAKTSSDDPSHLELIQLIEEYSKAHGYL